MLLSVFPEPDSFESALNTRSLFSLLALEEMLVSVFPEEFKVPRMRQGKVDALVKGFRRVHGKRKATGRHSMQMDAETELSSGECCYCKAPQAPACSVCRVACAHIHCCKNHCPVLYVPEAAGPWDAPLNVSFCFDCAKEKLAKLPLEVASAAHLRFSQARQKPGWSRAQLDKSLSNCLPLRRWKVCPLSHVFLVTCVPCHLPLDRGKLRS